MKKILFIFLTFILVSCDDALNSPAVSNGEIIKVTKYSDNVVIHVRFKGVGNYSCTFQFIGSDTCRVGQQIKLQ